MSNQTIDQLTKAIKQMTLGHFRIENSDFCEDKRFLELSAAIRELADRLEENHSQSKLDEKYRTLFEVMTHGVVFISFENNTLSLNPAAEKILGGKPKSLPALKDFCKNLQIVDNHERPLEFDEIPPIITLKSGKDIHDMIIGIINLHDHSRKWLNVNSILVHEKDPSKQTGILVIFYDLTKYRHMQEKMIESTEQIQTAFESSIHGTCFISLDGHFIKTNRTMQEITGYSREELLVKTIQEITHPDDLSMDEELIQKLISGEIPSYQVQKRLIHKSGKIISVILGISIFRDLSFQPVHFISHIIDITTRTHALAALQKSEEALKRALQIARLGSMEWDYIKDEVSWSDEMYVICGVEKQRENPPLVQMLLENTHPSDRHALEIRLELGPIIGNVEPLEFRLYHPGGKMVWIKNETHFVFNETRNPVRMNATFQDITEIKEAEKELKTARDEAQRANRIKSEFLANVSHEIRTPMNAILGFTHILENLIQDSNQRKMLKNITTSANSLLNLLNDILDLSKVESGKLEIQPSPVRMANVMEEISEMFSLRIAEKNLEYHYHLDPAFPESIDIDEIRIRQILLNLIGNAIKFTHQGSVTVSIDQLSRNIATKRFNMGIVIKDTGIGIAHDQIDQIFEAFRQQAGQDNKKYGGTGLGLAITKRLVELMDGEIFLESAEGSGSVFTVILRNITYTPKIKPSAKKYGIQSNGAFQKHVKKRSKMKSLSSEEHANLLKLQKRLENDFYPQWEAVQKTFMLNKIEKFAEAINLAAQGNLFPPLAEWGLKLKEQVSNLDLEQLPDTLSHYPAMLEELKELIKESP